MNGASFALLKIPAVIVPGVTGARWSQKLAELARRPHECVRSETDMEVLHTPPAQAQMREESGRLFSVAQFTTDRFIFQEREQIRQQLVSDIRDAKSREAVLADFDRTIAEFKNSKDTLEAALTQTTMLEGSLSDFEKELEAACLERLCPLSRAIRVEIVCFWTLDRMHEITSQFERALTLLREAASLQPSPEVPLERDFVRNLNARLDYLEALYRTAFGVRTVEDPEEAETHADQQPTVKAAFTRAGHRAGDPAYQELLAQAEQEEAGFMKLREELRQKHPEAKYVAMWKGVPSIFGQTLFEVAKKFLSEFGSPPGYIGELADVPQAGVLSSSFSGQATR